MFLLSIIAPPGGSVVPANGCVATILLKNVSIIAYLSSTAGGGQVKARPVPIGGLGILRLASKVHWYDIRPPTTLL